METTTCSHLLGLVVISFILVPPKAFAADGVTDTFSKGRNITDNETLVSANGAFTMGFFSPGVSTKRYLGIWFTVSRDAVCWVANRESPIHDNSGVLMVSDTGSLLLLDGSGWIAWSSNSSSTSPVEAQLLDNGNLVVRNPGSTTVLWHSFAHPSNVMLSGMKVGKDFSSGDEWYLTSWRSADDPSPGAFRRVLDTSGRPDNIVWQGSVKTFRSGPWNGVRFGGIPEVLTYQQDLRLAESELPPPAAALPPPSLPSRSRAFPTGPVIGAVGSLVGILLVAFLVLVVIRRRRRRRPQIGACTHFLE